MGSVYECSRNDIVSNLSVFVAAILVWMTESAWLDLVAGFCLALLLRSAHGVMPSALAQLRVGEPRPL